MEVASTTHSIAKTTVAKVTDVVNTTVAKVTEVKNAGDFVFTMTRFVLPAVCALGLVGNVLSLYVLLSAGLRKSSSIFLFALTFADACSLLYQLDVSRIIFFYGTSIGLPGWEFSPEVAYGLYIMNQAMQFVTNLGGFPLTTLPVVIMVERCLAVFWPLKFKRLVTARRAWIVIICVYLFWLPWILNGNFWYSYIYVQYKGASFGFMLRSSYYTKNLDIINTCNNYFFSALASWVPVILVIVGAVLLGIKIKISHRKRMGLLSSSSSETRPMTRTTRTLVSVSIMFAVLYGFGYLTLLAKLADISYYSNEILQQTRFLATYINSSVNFLVYFAMNGKFRRQLKLVVVSLRCVFARS